MTGIEETAPPALEDTVTYRLLLLADTIERSAIQLYATRRGVSIAEMRVLALVGRHQPLAANEVSRRSRIDKGWISRSVTALVGRGLVARTPHPTDHRIALLSLTPAGEALTSQLTPLAAARHEWLLAGLGADQRTLLFRLIDQLQERADDLLANPEA